MQGRGRPGASGPLDGARRRSVYQEVRRNFLNPFMLVFDEPIPTTTVGARSVSNVPAQGLTLMNDPFVRGQAERQNPHPVHAAYQRLEPRHWSPDGKAESAADFTARSWSVGQTATLAAVAELLATRVRRARDAGDAGHPQRWPEFAEFDCYSCHRTLGPDTNAASREPALRRPRPGQPSWQPWQVAGARLLRAGLEGPVPIPDTTATALEQSTVDIRLLLDTQWAATDRERLNRLLLEASGLAFAARRSGAEIDARPRIVVDASHQTLDAIAAANPAEWQTWDAAVQTYLALEAGRQGGPATIGIWRNGGQGIVSTVSASEPRRSLDELRASLRFPPDVDTPGPFDLRSFQRARRLVP